MARRLALGGIEHPSRFAHDAIMRADNGHMEFNAQHLTAAAEMADMYRAAGDAHWAEQWEVVASVAARERIAQRAAEREIAARAERIAAAILA